MSFESISQKLKDPRDEVIYLTYDEICFLYHPEYPARFQMYYPRSKGDVQRLLDLKVERVKTRLTD